jgi:hypothetical protein
MTGLICTALGCLPAQVDSIPWPEAMDLLDYWAAHPPVHVLVAGFMGLKPKKKLKKTAQPEQPQDVQSLVNLLNGL